MKRGRFTRIRSNRLLIDAGADVNARDADGDTPLHMASHYRVQAPLAQLLIDAGADVEAENNAGRRPVIPSDADQGGIRSS